MRSSEKSSKSLSIPIFIDEPTGIDRPGETIVGGVPLPKGAIRKGCWFRAKGPGKDKPFIEGTPAAWWPDGSVKWMHLCGQLDLAGGKRNAFTLRPAQPHPRAALGVAKTRGGLKITGGLIDVEVQPQGRAVLQAARPGRGARRELLRGPGLSVELTLADHEGQRRRTVPLELGPRVTIAAQSASRVVLRMAGTFTDHGKPAGEMILFVEVLRAQPELRLQPVMIFLADPDATLYAGLTVTLHSAFGGKKVGYGLANEQGKGYWDVVNRFEGGPSWPLARQVQLGATFFTTEKRTAPDCGWVKAAEGGRSQGWCHLAGEGGGVTAAMRYFWQECPHSLAIDAAEGTLSFGLIAPEGAGLDLRRYDKVSHGRVMYETGSGPLPKELGAIGIAKAHELCLRFHQAGDADIAERAVAFASPCRAMVSPDYFAGCNVVGRVGVGRGKHKAIQARMNELADFMIAEREHRGWYGLMDFGDVMSGYYTDRETWAFDDGGYAWINTESLPDLGLWLSALLAGRSDWLEASIEMSRHNRDVDCYHRGPVKGHGTRHNVKHWGCRDKEFRVSMPLVRRLHYYMTADPWSREAIVETVALYQSLVRTKNTAPSMTSVLAGIMVKHELTGDGADERTLRNFAAVMGKAFGADGQVAAQIHVDLATGRGHVIDDGEVMTWKAFFLNNFGGQHTLVELADLLDVPELTEGIVRHADMFLSAKGGRITAPTADARGPRGFGLENIPLFLAHAWRKTGDRRYQKAVARALEGWPVSFTQIGGDGILQTPRRKVLAAVRRPNKIACTMGIRLHLLPYALAALAE